CPGESPNPFALRFCRRLAQPLLEGRLEEPPFRADPARREVLLVDEAHQILFGQPQIRGGFAERQHLPRATVVCWQRWGRFWFRLRSWHDHLSLVGGGFLSLDFRR